MTQDRISTTGHERPRVRRGLGLLVGATLMLTPLALAPAASAQTAAGGPLGGTPALLTQTVTSLPNTVGSPLGGGGGNGVDACKNPELLIPFVTCLIQKIYNALYGHGNTGVTKAKAKAKIGHSVAAVRWVK